jgi:hypothetical protein
MLDITFNNKRYLVDHREHEHLIVDMLAEISRIKQKYEVKGAKLKQLHFYTIAEQAPQVNKKCIVVVLNKYHLGKFQTDQWDGNTYFKLDNSYVRVPLSMIENWAYLTKLDRDEK